MDRTSNGHKAAPPESSFQIVGIHSYRGGSGKTTLAANLAYLAARGGAKVAVMDADLQAPALHTLLGVETKRILHSVSEFVRGQCDMGEVPLDLTRELGLEEPGTLHFLPAAPDLQMTTSILFEGYDVPRLNEHMRRLAHDLEIDLLILDTHLGVNRETLLSLATSDTVLVLQRPDGQDQLGTSLLVQIAKKVGVPSCLMVPNMVAADSDPEEVRAQTEKELEVPVAAVLPWCPEIMELGCHGIFAARYPDHPFTAELERLVQQLTASEVGAGGGK